MPGISVTLPDIEDSVSRPVIHSVISDIFRIMNLRDSPTVLYGGKRNTLVSDNGSLTAANNKNPRMEKDDLCFVQVKETYNRDNVNYVHNNNRVERALFYDSHLGVRLSPFYFITDVDINVRYRSTSETEVRRCYSHLFSMASQGRASHLHRLTYTYPLSPEFLVLLEHIYTLRENVAGYGDDFQTYLKTHAREQYSLAMSQSGANRHLIVTETLNRIQGEFDFIAVPDEPDYLKEHGVWEINFNYRFQYNRIDGMVVEYPVSVHNQMIDSRLLGFLSSTPDPEQAKSGSNHDIGSLEMFGMDNVMQPMKRPRYIKIPAIDDFGFDNGVPYNTSTVMVALSSLEDDKRTILDLNELGDYSFDPDILEFIKTEYPHMTTLYKSFINVTLYIGQARCEESQLEITPNLQVRCKYDLDPRNQHRIRISLSPFLSGVSHQAMVRLRNNPKAFVKIIASMNELLASNPDFNNLGNQPTIKAWQFNDVYQFLIGMEQGLIGSPNRNIGSYFPLGSLSQRVASKGFLGSLTLDEINRYLVAKRGYLNNVAVGYVFAKTRK